MFSVIYVLTSVIYVSNTLGSIYGHHDDLPHFGGIFDRSLRSPLLFWSLFFLVFKSLNINANFILLMVSNTTKTDCFVFFFCNDSLCNSQLIAFMSLYLNLRPIFMFVYILLLQYLWSLHQSEQTQMVCSFPIVYFFHFFSPYNVVPSFCKPIIYQIHIFFLPLIVVLVQHFLTTLIWYQLHLSTTLILSFIQHGAVFSYHLHTIHYCR